MIVTLENDSLKASISPLGAELQSLFSKKFNLEYLWNGDEKYWPRHSPVLFPIVGGLKDDTFIYKGAKYSLIKHGFTRDTMFEVEKQTESSATFVLRSNDEMLKHYPFYFKLRLHYILEGDSIKLTYEVKNPSVTPMFFSLGAHPAFNVPLIPGTAYHDYYLQFQHKETSLQWKVDGNLLSNPVPYLTNQDKLVLRHNLFYDDAVIFKDLKSHYISILSEKTEHGIRYHFEGFPYMGIWAAKDAPFVCIEPWCGLPDSVNHNQDITKKEGIIELPPLEKWSKSWKVECF